jgi:hypothetical protein
VEQDERRSGARPLASDADPVDFDVLRAVEHPMRLLRHAVPRIARLGMPHAARQINSLDRRAMLALDELSLAHRHDDLPSGPALRHVLDGGGGLLKRVGPFDGREHLA